MNTTERIGALTLLLLTFGVGCGEDEGKSSGGASGSAGTDNAAGAGDTAGSPEEPGSPTTGGGAGGRVATAGAAGSAEPEGGSGSQDEGGGGSAGTPDDSGASGEAIDGFAIRAPEERSLTCSVNPMETTEPALLVDEDYVCTLAYGPTNGVIYVQATPTDCQVLMGATPTAFTVAGWVAIDDVVTPLQELLYDHGGNHFNNTIEFDHGGQRYRYAHSSIGFGGRSCQPPDCLQVYEPDGATLVEDGCTAERALPVVCVAVAGDAVVPPLEDTFAPCPGDPNQ